MAEIPDMALQAEADYLTQVEEIAAKYRGKPEDIVLALHAVQDLKNYLPREALSVVARVLKVSESRVYGVAKFYSMFSTTPRGRHIIRICESTPCHVMGKTEIIDSLCNILGVEIGGTTKDGRFTVEVSSCLGVCGVAPAMMIDDEVYGNLVPEDLNKIFERYK